MKLLEREPYLERMDELFDQLRTGRGHTVFIMGEAGIGKTSLLRAFSDNHRHEAIILTGMCDSLLTPRPLGPMYDLTAQLGPQFQEQVHSSPDRSLLFSLFMGEIRKISAPVIIIIEDIHWADEGSMDFIKFLARRADQAGCLFLLTFRDDEISPEHPIRSVLGDIPSEISAKMNIRRLSRETVDKLAGESGYDGDKIYALTGGNPFYVNEILADYSTGIPETIKDSVLGVFYRQDEKTRTLWELLSIFPGKTPLSKLRAIRSDLFHVIDESLSSGVILLEGDALMFKHELYRKIIEESLSPITRIEWNERVLAYLLEHKQESDLSMIVHHAENAKNVKIARQYTPEAAAYAASCGAHIESAKLYAMAIQYAHSDPVTLATLYEKHAYECYLTIQIESAINSQKKALAIWKEQQEPVRVGSSLRSLSRLYWFSGNTREANDYGLQAIEVLEKTTSKGELAKAYSNYSQLKMLNSNLGDCIAFGRNAIKLARKIGDPEIEAHALNNIGTIQFAADRNNSAALQESLKISLEHKFHEHAARAYTNYSCICMEHKMFDLAGKLLEDGIQYSRERDLDSWKIYMQSWQARYYFETCQWEAARKMCRKLLRKPDQPNIVRVNVLEINGRLEVRQGNRSGLEGIMQAGRIALETGELSRLIRVAVALLEFKWIHPEIETENLVIDRTKELLEQSHFNSYFNELAYWLEKNNMPWDKSKVSDSAYGLELKRQWKKAAEFWERMNNRYDQALALLEGDPESKKEAVRILISLDARGTVARVKQHMRSSGIRSIPRGPRQQTRKNPAQLTSRQMEVLKCIKEGMANTEIAECLFISPKTVDHHVTAILSKLNVHSRSKAVSRAEKMGII